jgi:hypothetical protein
MTELSQARAETIEQPEADATARLATASKPARELLFGVQRVMFDELLFVSNEMLDRARTETHLFAELISKMAGAHSVKDIKMMYEECGQHQIDFIRRDCERVFKHGHRMIETTSNLFSNRTPGSWWPEWTRWLGARSGEPCEPPQIGVIGADGQSLLDAPGDYVHR